MMKGHVQDEFEETQDRLLEELWSTVNDKEHLGTETDAETFRPSSQTKFIMFGDVLTVEREGC